ncbi:hypothetical protein Tco_1042422 [Tanacetum coccineum]|uniref:Uncharacterized protein n=1 Tax=Tanacetum coccineum TaxID=301880 RepID=A0ABQ5GLC1_9ASTR
MVRSTKRVKISPTNVILETTVHQKEETFQVIIDVIKNSTYFKAFTISAEVPEIFMQQFLISVKELKVKNSLRYKMMITTQASQHGMFYKENVDYPELIWEDFAFQVDHKMEKNLRRKNYAIPQIHENDGVVSRLKFVRIGEDYQEYGLPIPETMLTEGIRRVVKKKVIVTADDNIVPEPDVALELGKSISLTEAAEEEAARQVHATHKMSSDPSQKLKGVQTLTPEEHIVADIMKELKERVPDESTVIPATSSEGTGTKPGVLDEEKVTSEANVILECGSEQESGYSEEEDDDDEMIEWVDTDEEEEKKDDDDDKIIDLEQIDDEETNDEFVHEVTDAAKVDARKSKEVKDDAKKAELPPTSSNLSVSSGFGDQFLKLLSDTSLISTVKDTIDTKINSLLDIKIQSQVPDIQSPPLRIAKLEEDVSELKKIDHSAKAIASLKSQVLTVIENYLGSKLPAPEPSKIHTSKIDLELEFEKSASKIHKIKKEQAEKQKMPKNHANHALYHALMEALIEDENDMDKGVADTVKNHKRQHDDEDDDEDPSVGPNQGKAPSKSSKVGKSATTQEPIEEPIAEVVMDDLETTAKEDVVNDADRPQDYVAPKTNKPSKDTWFKQPPRPLTPDTE